MSTRPQPASETPQPKRDFRQEVTDNIVRLLEEGVAPWQKPWDPAQAGGKLPLNPTTDKAYRGGNAIHLLATGMQRGYADPRWMTYKQAAEHGWQVRKGEKGTQIEFWDVQKPEKDARPTATPDSSGGKENEGPNHDRPRLIHRVYTVFNASQIEGVPEYKPEEKTAFEVVQAGEQILNNSGAAIKHDQVDRAFYNRAQDSIHLPGKEAFRTPEGYYGTALRELAHWVGHPSRLNRPTLNESYRFGDTNYAKEELRAELTSVFLAAERGIPHDPAQHAAYVDSWIRVLKEDKNEIFRAAHDAPAATEYLLGLERSHSRDAGQDSPASVERSTAPGRASDNRSGDAPVRETSEHVARVERGSGTLNVHDKQSATDRRSTVIIYGTPSEPRQNEQEITSGSGIGAAHAIASGALGQSARTYLAQTESGHYRGAVLGETQDHLVQRLSAASAVAHPKDSLDKIPSVGQHVAVDYSGSKGTVREVRERAKTQDRGR